VETSVMRYENGCMSTQRPHLLVNWLIVLLSSALTPCILNKHQNSFTQLMIKNI